MITFRCKKCEQKAAYEYGDDNEGTGLCYYCFEDGMEEYEERRRQRIAEANEY